MGGEKLLEVKKKEHEENEEEERSHVERWMARIVLELCSRGKEGGLKMSREIRDALEDERRRGRDRWWWKEGRKKRDERSSLY